MKLVAFERGGVVSFGSVKNDGIVDLSKALDAKFSSIRHILTEHGLSAAKVIEDARAPDVKLGAVKLLPVIPDPGKIWCCGLNYRDHVRETNREITEQPVFFLRVADSQVGHEQPILCPRESTMLDYEGEIAVVIGTPGRRISEADAWQHIAGYACYNDASIRDWQRHSQQWAPGKNFWHTGGFGPWLLTADEIPAGAVMTLVTRLNGTEMQRATTDMMIHSIPRQIAYLSTIAPLQSGDVIVTGTPGGVGARRQPPVWMKPGDVVEIDVAEIGVLRNPIVAES
jgi:2-keto-4-pentenoate hydratase/2-oxohepta-3-ene-1,7-dioic acid hydratase in catechol pathway